MTELVDIKNSKGYQDILQKAQPGDMIEFVRGSYSHWAIYIGNGFIIHRWGENDGIGQSVGVWGNVTTVSGVQFNKAKILNSDISDVLKHGGSVRVNNYRDKEKKPLPVKVILEKAQNALHQEGYNLIYNNCEHFTTECRYGQSTSRQVQVVVGSSIATGILISLLAATGAYFLSGSSQKEGEKKNPEATKIKM